ncbi:MAG TPA: radical SAM protein [Thermoanaerobaculia bacterium]|nr:radical SAM protein [Thermoanaerobaculia bacterium]
MSGSLSLFLDPVTAEKRRILAERWAELDPGLRFPGQGLGRQATGCGATAGVEPRCDFACTGCYLGSEANRTPSLPTAAILAQLDLLRRHLGPKSNVQITDGEVTLRPVEELVAILRHARAIGVIPMLMTHGDSFRRRPGLLERLMQEGGLTEVSIHVDITQRGRVGYRAPRSELELQPLREEFASMIRAARKTTELPLRAAQSLTVTGDNLPQIADVVRWSVRNRDAFRLISFQPLAQVGRTRKGMAGVSADELWQEIGRATADFGLELRGAAPLHAGHPDCSRLVPLVAIERRGRRCQPIRLLQLIRDRPEDLAIVQGFFGHGLGGAAFRDDRPLERFGRAAGLLRRAPRWLLGPARRWADGRLRAEAGLGLLELLAEAVRGRARVDGFTLTSHHFMSPAELTTEVGRQRLAACVFRVPYQGEMVPMCRLNAGGLRAELYAGIGEG